MLFRRSFSLATNAIAVFAFVLHFETDRFTIKTNFDMETNVNNTTEPQHDAKLPVMPRFFARGQFVMWILNIEYNGKEWTSMCTDDHIRDKDIIIKKAISDLKEEGLIVTESDVKYWDCKWNVPLY